MSHWNNVKHILPNTNRKVIAIFDHYVPSKPGGDLAWHATRQFVAYLNDKEEWMIYGPFLSHHAETIQFFATHWTPELQYPEEIIMRNRIELEKIRGN